jgi:hypothetical protein
VQTIRLARRLALLGRPGVGFTKWTAMVNLPGAHAQLTGVDKLRNLYTVTNYEKWRNGVGEAWVGALHAKVFGVKAACPGPRKLRIPLQALA